ncbi:hypothetical protein [Novipirellula maiorica]|nr:hypothetical protein [Rhodopirellula maiorica]
MARKPRFLLLFLVSLLSVACLDGRHANAYTSEDPVVQKMVDGGIRYLEANLKAQTKYPLNVFYSGGYGEHALAGYAHMKLRHDPQNPVVVQGIRSALSFVRAASGRDNGGHESKSVYVAAVSTLLLAEVDRIKYRKELEQLEKYFRRVQFRNGGYGYPGDQQGDVSQTQYAMLAIWTLDRAGLVVDYEGVAATVNWLMRVQDPSGGWPYKGIDPGSGKRVKQQNIKVAMTYAGSSALLIGADTLRLWGGGPEEDGSGITGLPKAVGLFKEGFENISAKRPQLPVEPIISSIEECERWLAANKKKGADWPYYNIYTIERYESFREIALKLEKNPSPAWYNEGVEFLKSKEQSRGGWPPGIMYSAAPISTSLALLFLSRSTQKAIAQASTGATQGGWGLPEDTTAIKVEGTQIKGSAPANEVNDLLDMLSEDEGGGLEGKSIPEDLKLDPDPKKRAAQIDRLERLVRGSRSWQARRVAARLLGQSDEMRVVPTLIFALSDPDPSVPRYARDGLRFISRRFEGFGMPDKPNKSEVTQAQMQWREWYRKFNPGYVFIDYDL